MTLNPAATLRLSDPVSRLPQEAQSKYVMLHMEAVDGRDAATDAAAKLSQEQKFMVGKDATTLSRTREQNFKKRLTEAQGRAFATRDLLGNLDLFLARLANNRAIQVTPFDGRRLPKKLLAQNESAEAAVAAIREKIDDCKSRIATTLSAPLKGRSKRDLVKRHLDSLVAKGQPNVRVDPNTGEVFLRVGTIPDTIALADARGNHLVGLVLSLFGTEEILNRLAPQEPERAGALTPAERDEKLSELRTELLLLERTEEHLISSGTGITRRPDADPRAVLQIECPMVKSIAA